MPEVLKKAELIEEEDKITSKIRQLPMGIFFRFHFNSTSLPDAFFTVFLEIYKKNSPQIQKEEEK